MLISFTDIFTVFVRPHFCYDHQITMISFFEAPYTFPLPTKKIKQVLIFEAQSSKFKHQLNINIKCYGLKTSRRI